MSNEGFATKSGATLRLAWLAVIRRKRRTIIAVILLSFVIGSSVTIGATLQQFPNWVSALSSSSPDILLTYESNSSFVGLLPVNSTIPMSDLSVLDQINGVTDATPLIIKDLTSSISPSAPSLIVGLDVNFWQLGLGLSEGHWPQPGTNQAVITVSNAGKPVPSTVTVQNETFQIVGVAASVNLLLVNSIIISFGTAQKIFSLAGSSSVFISQVSSSADSTLVINGISRRDPKLSSVDLSSSTQVLSTVSKVVGAISGAVVLVEGLFAFAILTTLTLSTISTRSWEYGLVSAYGSRRSILKMILYENWVVFLLAIVPALILSIGILGFFTFYFNQLFGTTLSSISSVAIAASQILSLTTALNFLASFVAATLGSLVALRIVLRKRPGELLSDAHT